MAKVDLFSPFPLKECVDRLRTGLHMPPMALEGRVQDGRLRLNKQLTGLNSFQSYLFAVLTPDGTGTRISGTVGLHPAVKVGIPIWFGFVVILWTLFVLSGAPLPMILGPLGLMIVAALFFWLGRLVCRHQDRLLLDFVISAVEANEVAVEELAKPLADERQKNTPPK